MNRRLVLGIVYIIIGALLSILSFTYIIDEWWQSFGIAIGIVGVVDIIRVVRYRSNAEYKEKVDMSYSDERNKFLSMKAWSWAGYLFVIVCGLGVIGFQIAGMRSLSMACSVGVCLVLVFYWLSYLWLSKKY